ncbi:MAG: TIGR00159 family protein [Ignavibacteriales bacterium]|nr:MAG: TIGR00159 family protein [Ignavibacteriales bacterium]
MFDVIKIGFLTVTFVDLIDILIVSFIVYKLYTILKGTIAAQIFIGLMIVLILSFVSQASNLRALSWLLKLVTDIWVIAFVILFQPEIRRLLVIVARNPFFKMFVKSDSTEAAVTIADAAFELSQQQHGALMILIKSSGIRGYAETGELLEAKLTKSMLTSIFFPRSPLHDGAVIIKGNIIEAARCTLPLSSTTMVNGESLGMRHRAGLGISEQADVISVIVSEETGSISVAENGHLTKGLSKDGLIRHINRAFRAPVVKGWKGIIEQYFKEK